MSDYTNYISAKHKSDSVKSYSHYTRFYALIGRVCIPAKTRGFSSSIRDSTARLCNWFSGAFDVTGKMDDTTAILTRSRDLYAQVETHEQFATLTRATERYLVQLQFWGDCQIPWPAISDLVHGYRLRTETGETR